MNGVSQSLNPKFLLCQGLLRLCRMRFWCRSAVLSRSRRRTTAAKVLGLFCERAATGELRRPLRSVNEGVLRCRDLHRDYDQGRHFRKGLPPAGCYWWGYGAYGRKDLPHGVKYRANSSLLIVSGCREVSERTCATFYYELKNDELVLVRLIPFKPPIVLE